MERGVFQKTMEGGLKEWPGVQIIMNATRIGGTWSNWYDSMFQFGGFQARDFFCVTDFDDKFKRYQAFYDANERKNLAEQIQQEILENYYFVPVFRHAFVNAIGQRIAATKLARRIPDRRNVRLPHPWEDIELKEAAAAEK